MKRSDKGITLDAAHRRAVLAGRKTLILGMVDRQPQSLPTGLRWPPFFGSPHAIKGLPPHQVYPTLDELAAVLVQHDRFHFGQRLYLKEPTCTVDEWRSFAEQAKPKRKSEALPDLPGRDGWVYLDDGPEDLSRHLMDSPFGRAAKMKRSAARSWLVVTGIRYTRVWSISEKDCKAEGIRECPGHTSTATTCASCDKDEQPPCAGWHDEGYHPCMCTSVEDGRPRRCELWQSWRFYRDGRTRSDWKYNPLVRLLDVRLYARDGVVEADRAGGDVECDICGKPYRKHPLDEHPVALGNTGGDKPAPFLNVLCDGRRVKL